MPKTAKKHSKPARRRGTAQVVEAIVGDKKRAIGLVSIENDGKDDQGRVMGTNGIAWRVA